VKKFSAILFTVLCGLFCLTAFAAETIPPRPQQYFNDYAGVVSPATAAQLNQKLEQFERDTSSQILVVVYPKMQSDSSIEDYTIRVAQSWGVGQKGKDNGAVLFVFIQDRKMFIQTGYGLEGALPDVINKRIIADEIVPAFRAGNFDAGLTAGVSAMLAAAKGEYKGTGQTVAERNAGHDQGLPPIVVLLGFILIIVVMWLNARRQARYGGYYSRGGWSGGGLMGGGMMGGGMWGGGGRGGGFGGGGGGGFSGGGGSFGGGGAGGSW
jgi:uncharacterized protein